MNKLKIAIQKSGRLSDNSIKLLNGCSLSFQRGKQKLIAPCAKFPADILYLRDDDIPQYVADGVADLGILGLNVVKEKAKQVQIEKYLGFSSCRLSLAVPKEANYNCVKFFDGKRIATSYPKLTQKYLASKGVKAEIHEISGSVEIATGIGLADGICDLVSTGGTLLSNGLKEVDQVLESEAVLITNPQLNGVKQQLVNQLLFRIEANLKAKRFKYILMNAPNDQVRNIVDVLPGMKSPTVLPLANGEWSSIHTVIEEEEYWNILEKLKGYGIQGILLVPIERMIL